LNERVKALKAERDAILMSPNCVIGEVVKMMNKKTCLVKVSDQKKIVAVSKTVDVKQL